MSEHRPYYPPLAGGQTAAQQPNLRPAFVVGALAALLRVVWVLIASRPPLGLSDPFIYLNFASSIAAGDGYNSLLGHPTAYFPPGYPFFLGGVQWVLQFINLDDHLVLVIGLIQALLGGVAAGAIVVTGDQLLAPSRGPYGAVNKVVDGLATVSTDRHRQPWSIGVIAGLLFTIWPNLILHTPLIMGESLFLALFWVLVAALVTWTSRAIANAGATRPVSSWQLSALIVVMTIGCTWVRPQSVVLLVPAIVVAWTLGRVGWRHTLQCASLVLVGMVVAIVPWTMRNAVVMNSFIPMSTNTGDNLCIGFHTGAMGGYRETDACAAEGRYVDGPAIEVARDKELRARALRWIVAHPDQLPKLTWQKLVATFRFENDALRTWEGFGADPHLGRTERQFLHALGNRYYWIVSILATVGLIIVVRDCWRGCREPTVDAALRNCVLIVAIAATGALVPVLFFGDSRFKVPIVPCLALLAAVGIHRLLVHIHARRIRIDELPQIH